MSKLLFALHIEQDAVPKARARGTRSGRHYTPEKTRTWENTVKQLAQINMMQRGLDAIECDVELAFVFDRKTSRRADLDNLIKSIKDGFNGVVWHDDKQVICYRGGIVRHGKKNNACVSVLVFEANHLYINDEAYMLTRKAQLWQGGKI